jgi:hypothetical protein
MKTLEISSKDCVRSIWNLIFSQCATCQFLIISQHPNIKRSTSRWNSISLSSLLLIIITRHFQKIASKIVWKNEDDDDDTRGDNYNNTQLTNF